MSSLGHHVGSVRAHDGIDVHVSERGGHVYVSFRTSMGDSVGAREVKLSPIVGRALAKLLQTASHESQRVRSQREGRA